MPLPINIQSLLSHSIIENERIEFKASWNPKTILKTICAFANDINNIGGGYILIGIEELDGIAQLPPKGLELKSIDQIQKELLQICHFIAPAYFPVVEPCLVQEQNILVLWVPPGDMRPYKAPSSLSQKHSKTHYVRKMASTVQANDQDLTRLLEIAARVPFDNRVNHHASITDFDFTLIAGFLQSIGSALHADMPTISQAALCRAMGIARGPDEDLRPINAGLLMFTQDPTQFFRGARIEIVEYGNEIGDALNETIFKGPIWLQLRDALRYLRHQVVKEHVRKIDTQDEAVRFYNYPMPALEEALANAVFHKGYDRDNPIEINIRHDQIEILSFPGPMPPVTQASLQQARIIARDYRNSRLGDFLKELKLTEARGTGLPKIRQAMAKNGSEPPIFETDSENFYFLTILKRCIQPIGISLPAE